MRHLNYNHLYYFWTVAREGSIARAAEVLHLTPQTISGQLRALAEDVGQPLFRRVGRHLELTPIGGQVLRYAEPIFSTGSELAERVRSGELMNSDRLRVGVVNSLAKLTVSNILAVAMDGPQAMRLSVIEGDLEKLLADLALHRLDMVLSDRSVPPELSVRAYSHKLGSNPIAWFQSESMQLDEDAVFPDCLQDVDLLLPLQRHPLRRRIESWFDARGWSPRVRAEFDDSALLKAFARTSPVVFPAPSSIAETVEDMYSARLLGLTEDLEESCYVLSTERQISHPMLKQVIEGYRGQNGQEERPASDEDG